MTPRTLWTALALAGIAAGATWLHGGANEAGVEPSISPLAATPHPPRSEAPAAPAAMAVAAAATTAEGGTPLPASSEPAGRKPVAPKSASHWLGRRIGSEGYGPHIAEIADHGSAPEALEAWHQIAVCDLQDELESHHRERRAVAHPARSEYETAEYLNREAVKLATERNRCQTVDAGVRVLAVALARRAAEARLDGGAMAYADAVLSSGQSALWPQALQELRAAAARMDGLAFTMLAWGDRSVAVDDVERRAYQLALERLDLEGWVFFGGGTSRIGKEGPMYEPALSREQLAEASRRAQALYADCCSGWKDRKK